MNTRTGKILTIDQVAAMPDAEQRFTRPMVIPPTPAQQRRGKVGRNDQCPCGSGRKFKKCCLQMSGGA